MDKTECKTWIGVAGGMLLAYALVFPQAASAGQNRSTRDSAGPPPRAAVRQASERPSAAAEKPSRDSSHEGVRVHGHWTIEVRNPDGTLVSHREFDNSLTNSGASLLGLLLSKQNTPGPWEIGVTGTQTPPCLAQGSGVACSIADPALGSGGSSYYFATLRASTSATGALVLSGTAVAGQTGEIDIVDSYEWSCSSTVSPANCTITNVGTAPSPFTQANISPAINVSIGQTIAVTVVISFS